MRFEFPAAFLLLLFTPLLLEHSAIRRIRRAFSRIFRRRSRGGEDAGNGDDPGRGVAFAAPFALSSLPRSLRLRLRTPLLNLLLASCYVLLVIALARPQTGLEFTETEASGRDLMFVLDVSRSMDALDFTLDGERTDRLTALKAVVGDFISRRKGDRMGLIVFGDEVYTQAPLTLDHRALSDFLQGLSVGMAGDATAMGDGIAAGIKRIKDIEAESKVLILVTDGVKTAGMLEPLDAAEIAKKLGIKIYTIGVGGKGPAPFRAQNLLGFDTMTYQDVPLDEEVLKKIAEMTGGQYFNAANTEQLVEVYDEIDKLEERKEKTLAFIEYEEHFEIPLALGFVCFLLAELLACTIFAVAP